MADTSLFWRGWPSEHRHSCAQPAAAKPATPGAPRRRGSPPASVRLSARLPLQLFYCAEGGHYLYGCEPGPKPTGPATQLLAARWPGRKAPGRGGQNPAKTRAQVRRPAAVGNPAEGPPRHGALAQNPPQDPTRRTTRAQPAHNPARKTPASRPQVVHHLATLALLAISFHWSFLRVGSVIMLLHDACDVWMEAAKLCNYAGLQGFATALFVIFVASWLLLRMVAFPLVVIRSTSVEAAAVLLDGYGSTPANRIIWASFNLLLLLLLALHFYWFWFIAGIAIRAIRAPIQDAREEEEAEEDKGPSPTKERGGASAAAAKKRK